MRVRRHSGAISNPYDNGRDQIAGACRIIVEHAEHCITRKPQPELLLKFSPCRLDRRLAFVAASAGQSSLAAMRAQS
ncbi:hypothetical protein WN73_12665 [Bradyrhizobium sp. CCBAU 45394]|nr:hypothetical protein [Bradyrhizobium sp. CCBAU 45394]